MTIRESRLSAAVVAVLSTVTGIFVGAAPGILLAGRAADESPGLDGLGAVLFYGLIAYLGAFLGSMAGFLIGVRQWRRAGGLAMSPGRGIALLVLVWLLALVLYACSVAPWPAFLLVGAASAMPSGRRRGNTASAGQTEQ
jgi:hypothetical protein